MRTLGRIAQQADVLRSSAQLDLATLSHALQGELAPGAACTGTGVDRLLKRTQPLHGTCRLQLQTSQLSIAAAGRPTALSTRAGAAVAASATRSRAPAPAAMGDLFDDPDVAGALAHCSSEWGGLSFGGDGADEEASFFDVTVALPPAVAFDERAPHACPRTPPGPPLYAPCAGEQLPPESHPLPSAPPVPPLPGGQGERGGAPAEQSSTPRCALHVPYLI